MLNARTFANEDSASYQTRQHTSPSDETPFGELVSCSPWEGLYLEQANANTTAAR